MYGKGTCISQGYNKINPQRVRNGSFLRGEGSALPCHQAFCSVRLRSNWCLIEDIDEDEIITLRVDFKNQIIIEKKKNTFFIITQKGIFSFFK